MGLENDQNKLIGELNSGLNNVDRSAKKYRRIHTTLVLITILFGLTATVLAGDSARNGKVIAGNTAKISTGEIPGDLPQGWRFVCGVIAVCTLLATTASSIDKILKITDHRAKAMACAGTLDALRAELQTNSHPTELEMAKIRKSYLNVRKQNPEYFR